MKDLVSLYKDVAREYIHMASDPVQIRHLVDRAVRIAKVERTVTCIVIPNDVQELDAVEAPPRAHGTIHSGIDFSIPRVIPKEVDLRRAADLLNAGQKVAMLVGAGALQAADEVLEVADLLGAGIAKALLGKAALPDDLPFVTGSIGLLGTKPSSEMMTNCDTLLMVGSNFPYSEFLPKEGHARGVQIDIDGRLLGLRYPMEVNLIGDSAETLRALVPFLKRKSDRAWRKGIEKGMSDWWKLLEARAMQNADPINPQRVFWELSPRLPDNCILSSDSGSAANWWEDLRITGGADPLSLGANNSGKGIGGGSVHWAGFAPRFHPSDFRVYSEDGVGADWAITTRTWSAALGWVMTSVPQSSTASGGPPTSEPLCV